MYKNHIMKLARLAPLLLGLLSGNALAQEQPTSPVQSTGAERKLIIFDDEPCPKDTICVVAPSSERFRIPKQFRRGTPSLENQSWTVRAQDTMELGKSGIDSCSNVGEAGWTGCFQKALRENKRIREEIDANARAKP